MCQFYCFIQLINKRRLLMKATSQNTSQKKKIKSKFIEKFKTQVKGTNSIENLRISKIDETCYKIYNTHHKNTTHHNPRTQNSKTNTAFFSYNRYYEINLTPTQKEVRLGASSEYFQKQCENKQIEKDNGWQAKSKYLQQVLRRRLEDFYKLIRNSSELTQQKISELHRLQELTNIISIVDIIYKNTSKLKSISDYHQQAHNINLILKCLMDKAQIYDQSGQTQFKLFSQHQDRIKTEVDEGSANLGQQILSISSFKIQNQKIHQQQFLNACLSNQNSKVDLNYSSKAGPYIRQECQGNDSQTPMRNNNLMRIGQKKSTSRMIAINTFSSQSKSSRIYNQNEMVCQLLKCDEAQKYSQIQDSQSKRRVLNQVIVLLNNKYNRCVKLQ